MVKRKCKQLDSRDKQHEMLKKCRNDIRQCDTLQEFKDSIGLRDEVPVSARDRNNFNQSLRSYVQCSNQASPRKEARTVNYSPRIDHSTVSYMRDVDPFTGESSIETGNE